MLESKDFSQLVAGRLLDFFGQSTPWYRGLWEVGLALSLREVQEASEAVQAGVLGQPALAWLLGDIQKHAGLDTGLEAPVRQALQRIFKSDLVFRSADWHSLDLLTTQIEATYLERWAEALRAGDASLKPERTARAIAAHLLDVGFSPEFLHRWWTYHVKHAPGISSLADLVGQAHQMAQQAASEFEVLVAVSTSLTPQPTPPREWRSASEVSRWLRANAFASSNIRQAGGWLFQVRARDSHAAIQRASEAIDRLTARLLIGSGTEMRPLQQAWVKGEKTALPLRSNRRIEVGSLKRQAQLFHHDGPSRVDAAFELLGQLQGPSALAVGAGWAAIEALLVAPGDGQKVPAADRLASLVACSFPRAELTTLAARQMRTKSPLASSLKACATNRERAAFIMSQINSNEPLDFNHWPDRAALARMSGLLAAPRKTLQDVESYAVRAFRRLYRQRNLALHGGKTNAVALHACLRTATPLIGAGIDRIAHAWFVHGLSPLELAVRARIRLDLLDTAGASSPVELLE